MLNLGFGEIFFIAVLALLLIGPKQLPEVARTIGRFLNELKRSANVLSDEFKNHASTQLIRLEDLESNHQPAATEVSKNSDEVKKEDPS